VPGRSNAVGGFFHSLSVSQAIVDQACFRASDVIFTARSTLQSEFSEDVEAFVLDTELPCSVAPSISGVRGPVQLDYIVSGRTVRSGLLAMGPRTSATAHPKSNEIFVRWYDLQETKEIDLKITVFDDHFKDVYRPTDLERIQEHSQLIPFSERDLLQELLAA
jgi:hypothetical protein